MQHFNGPCSGFGYLGHSKNHWLIDWLKSLTGLRHEAICESSLWVLWAKARWPPTSTPSFKLLYVKWFFLLCALYGRPISGLCLCVDNSKIIPHKLSVTQSRVFSACNSSPFPGEFGFEIAFEQQNKDTKSITWTVCFYRVARKNKLPDKTQFRVIRARFLYPNLFIHTVEILLHFWTFKQISLVVLSKVDKVFEKVHFVRWLIFSHVVCLFLEHS